MADQIFPVTGPLPRRLPHIAHLRGGGAWTAPDNKQSNTMLLADL